MSKSKAETKQFPLLKYFSRTSLVLVSLVAIVLALSYRQQTISTLIEHGEQSNVVLTKAVSNTIWPEFKVFMPEASSLSQEELKAHPKTAEMHRMVLAHIKDTPILKVKIFDLKGKTVYSTDPSQTGVQKPADYPGSISARTGEIISKLSHRDVFKSVHAELHDRQVVSSYLPIHDSDLAGLGVAGVIEIYYDVTDQFSAIQKQQWLALFFIVLMLGVLYMSLFLIVKRADRIIFLQSLSLKESLKKIQEKSAQLERKERSLHF